MPPDSTNGTRPLPRGIEREAESDILIVDDDPSNLRAMEVALGPLADRMVKARSGEDALRELLNRDYAVILLDVKMPDMDGFETARLVRSRGRTRHVPIIFVTAYSQNDSDMRRGYNLGAVDYLFKPIVPEVLRAKVQVFVELRERNQEVARQAEQLREMERAEAAHKLVEERRRWEAETLRKQNQQLADTDRRKDEFIAMLAHELRNPLAPLVTGLELMRMMVPEQDDDTLTAAREAMERQVNHLIRMVDDLLDVSRISRGKMELHCETLDLKTVIEEAVAGCRNRVEAERHRLQIAGAHDPVTVYADPMRLSQIISNLLNNAVRYTDPGGDLAIAWEAVGNNAVIRVKDSGRGIPAELRDKIFDMFVQERDGGRGLGLGLTLVKELVDMHGGSVEVQSEGPGKGSEFVVRIPRGEGLADTVPPPNIEAQAFQRRLHVAVVEDDQDVRNTLRSLLKRWGHRVSAADSGPAGVQLVVDGRPDIALLDVGLPGLDGYDVARRVRSSLGGNCPKLVAVTGYGQLRDKKRALEAGFDAHLVKPTQPRELRRTLNRLG